MALADIDPKKRVEVVLHEIARGYREAAEMVAKGDIDGMQRRLQFVAELEDPLERSLVILFESLAPKPDISKFLSDKDN